MGEGACLFPILCVPWLRNFVVKLKPTKNTKNRSYLRGGRWISSDMNRKLAQAFLLAELVRR